MLQQKWVNEKARIKPQIAYKRYFQNSYALTSHVKKQRKDYKVRD